MALLQLAVGKFPHGMGNILAVTYMDHVPTTITGAPITSLTVSVVWCFYFPKAICTHTKQYTKSDPVNLRLPALLCIS